MITAITTVTFEELLETYTLVLPDAVLKSPCIV